MIEISGGGNLLKASNNKGLGHTKNFITRKFLALFCNQADLENNRKHSGFTLAEVLITLGIIGVVAAMTIPNLMTNLKAIRLRSQFLESYSIIQQAFKFMTNDDVSVNPKDYSPGTFYLAFNKYLKGTTICPSVSSGNSSDAKAPCYKLNLPNDKKYHSLDGKSLIDEQYVDDGQLLLSNGSILIFENPNKGINYVWISVDINGAMTPPNRWGYDLFTLEMLDGELRAMGARGTKYTEMDKYCNLETTSNMNGIACAQKAIQDSEYFKNLVKKAK